MTNRTDDNNSKQNENATIWNPLKKGYWKKDNLLGRNKTDRFSMNSQNQKKRTIKETKCTCQACGNIWYYGKEDSIKNVGEKMESFGNSLSNTSKDMMCCGGCVPALFIPEKQEKDVKDLNQCQKCGSKAVKKEEVTHVVE